MPMPKPAKSRDSQGICLFRRSAIASDFGDFIGFGQRDGAAAQTRTATPEGCSGRKPGRRHRIGGLIEWPSSFAALSPYTVWRNARHSGRRRRGDEIAHDLDEARWLIELGKVTGLREDLQATARDLLMGCVGM